MTALPSVLFNRAGRLDATPSVVLCPATAAARAVLVAVVIGVAIGGPIANGMA